MHKKIWNRDFVKVCISSLFLFLTFYILIATLPMFVMDTLHGGEQQIGLVMTAFVIGAVIARPLAGKWADKPGRKTILIASLVCFLLCSCLYLFVASYPILLLLRFLHGISFGIATTVLGAVAVDLVPDSRKGEGIGYYTLFMSIAMVAGPFLGLTIVSFASFSVLFTVCLTFALLSAVCGIFARIPLPAIKAAALKETDKAFKWTDYVETSTIPIAVTGLVLSFVYGGIMTFLSAFAREIQLADIASLFFVVYAAAILISRPFTGRIFDRQGANKIVYPAILLFTVGMFVLSAADSALILLAAGALIGLGYGSIIPSFQTLAVQSAPAHRRGVATATYFLFFDAGFALGSSVLGMIAAGMNYRFMYAVCAFVVIFSAAMYFILQHRKSAAAANQAGEA